MIYLDNAATTKPSERAIAAFSEALAEFGNPHSSHPVGQRAAERLFLSRKTIAARLNAQPNEIFFTSGGCEGNSLAIMSAAESGAARGKRHIISQQTEHSSVLSCLSALRKRGFEVTLLPVDGEGLISPEAVKAAIRPDTVLVTIMTANNEIGTIQPIAEIGKICRESGVLFHTDAVQAAGVMPLDVKALCCDMLTISAHKFHGIPGGGALYARLGVPLSPIIFGTQERGARGGTVNLPGVAAMAAALDETCENMAENTKKITMLRDRLIEGISEMNGTLLNGSREQRLCGNVSFCFDGFTGEQLVYELGKREICASGGSACNAGSSEPSHVMLSLGRTPEQAKSALRLSLSIDSTEGGIAETLAALDEIINR